MAKRETRRASVAAATEPAKATHIVLFRQVSEQNAQFVRQVLSAAPMKSARSQMGIQEFGSAQTGTHASVYEGLGVAAVTASSEEVAELKGDPLVEEVFVNEERHIPTPVSDQPIVLQAVAEAPGLDYLVGLRDGLDTAIAALTGARRQPPPMPSRAPTAVAADTGDLTWGLQAIGLSQAYRFTGRGIAVAVLDTGIDFEHPDLKGRVVDGDTARSFVPGQGVQDGHGHGTHCCGTAAGPKGSVGGIRYGVAPDATLLVGKVLSNSGSGWDEQIIDGIQWAVSKGARIISLSLGSARAQNEPYNRLYERVAERLLEDRPGTLLVAAAGNDSRRPSFTRPVSNPAACPSIIAVAAVDRNLAIASFSCRQMDGVGAIEVSAPGVGVRSSVPGGGFANFDGTSQATPHVAGVAALYFEANAGLTAREAWDRLIADARPLGDPADFGSGLVRVPQGGGPGGSI